MTDPLPADVRKFLEDMGRLQREPGEWPIAKARELLAEFPKPAPAWQPGDVVLLSGFPYMRYEDSKWRSLFGHINVTDDDLGNAEPVLCGGRRVHPARFHDYAARLRTVAWALGQIAEWTQQTREESAAQLRAIADDMDPETPDA